MHTAHITVSANLNHSICVCCSSLFWSSCLPGIRSRLNSLSRYTGANHKLHNSRQLCVASPVDLGPSAAGPTPITGLLFLLPTILLSSGASLRPSIVDAPRGCVIYFQFEAAKTVLSGWKSRSDQPDTAPVNNNNECERPAAARVVCESICNNRLPDKVIRPVVGIGKLP